MNYRKKVVLMLGVLSYLNLGTFSQAAPLTVDHTSVAGVQQASNDKKTIKISGSVRDAAGYYQLGREYLKENPQNFGEIISRPVDRRENYVKRCVGLPGQTLEIKDRIIYLDGKA